MGPEEQQPFIRVFYCGSVNVSASSADKAVQDVQDRVPSSLGLLEVLEQVGEFVGALSFRIRKEEPDFLREKEKLRLSKRIPIIFRGEFISTYHSKEEAEKATKAKFSTIFPPDEQLTLFIDSIPEEE